jgi:hypothetical protein
MAAHEWIPLRIHPSHPKVLRLSAITGMSPYAIVGHAIAWFRYVDQQYAAADTGLDARCINIIMGLPAPKDPNLAQAFADPGVCWLAFGDDGKATVTDFDDNFGQSSRRRHLERRRKAEAAAAHRAQRAPQSSANGSAPSSAEIPQRVAPTVAHEVAQSCATNKDKDIDKEKGFAAAAFSSKAQNAPACEAKPVPPVNVPLVELLQERSVDQATIDWALENHELAKVRLAVGRMDAVAANDGKIDNPSGLLRELLTKGISGPVVPPRQPSRPIVPAGPTRAQRDRAELQQLVAVEQTRDQQVLAWLDSLTPEQAEQLRAEAIAAAPKIQREIWSKKTSRESLTLREAMYDLAHETVTQ